MDRPYRRPPLSSFQRTGRLPTRGPRREVTRGSYAVGRGATFNRPGAPAPMPVESKYFDTSFSQTVAVTADWVDTEVPCTNYIQSDGTTVGAYTSSALIPSAIGAGYGQINGNKYYLTKLRVRGLLNPAPAVDQADVSSPMLARVSLIMDTQPQGAQAQGESIFTDMGTSAQAGMSFLAMAAGSGGRFRVLKDKFYVLQPAVAGTDGASTNSVNNTGTFFKFNINFKRPLAVQLKANSSTPTVASLSNYNIFLLAHATTGPAVTIVGTARAVYKD